MFYEDISKTIAPQIWIVAYSFSSSPKQTFLEWTI